MNQTRSAVTVAANLSFIAGLVHLLATPEHFEEWWVYGAFFVAMTLFQLLFAAVLVMHGAGGNWLLLTGIVANLGIVIVYVLSRTAGVPIGSDSHHHRFHAESVGLLDISVTVAEVALIWVLSTLLDAPLRRRTMNALLITGASMWVLRFAGVLA